MKTSIGIALVLVAFIVTPSVREITNAAPEPTTTFVREPADVLRDRNERALRTLVDQDMDICGTPHLSVARRPIVREQIVRVAMAHDVPHEWREAFVGMICIESRYDPAAVSSAGAIGLTQVMPHLVQSFANLCSLGKLGPDDHRDPEVNLRLGACLYFHLLDHFGGNRVLAGSGYNSGAGSKTTRAIAKLGTGHPETSGWLAKYFSLMEQRRATTKEGTK